MRMGGKGLQKNSPTNIINTKQAMTQRIPRDREDVRGWLYLEKKGIRNVIKVS